MPSITHIFTLTFTPRMPVTRASRSSAHQSLTHVCTYLLTSAWKAFLQTSSTLTIEPPRPLDLVIGTMAVLGQYM